MIDSSHAATAAGRRRGRGAAVGRAVARKEGVAKVTGAARYVDDLSFPGMLHGATVRSTISRGEILSIRHAFGRDGFTVVDFRDIPGRNVVALIEDDQPRVRRGQPCTSCTFRRPCQGGTSVT